MSIYLTTEKTGRIWTWSTLIRDHTQFVTILPTYLAAYIVPGWALPSFQIEQILLTVNSYHTTCPYCTGLNGELARMAGVTTQKQQQLDIVTDPALAFAKVFAMQSGRGSEVDAAYKKLILDVGPKKAKSIQSLCWALLWGKTTGNTINNARDKVLIKDHKSSVKNLTSIEIFVAVYYGPLFGIVGILNMLLRFMPEIPTVAGNALGAVLWVPIAVHILPLGLVSIVLNMGIV